MGAAMQQVAGGAYSGTCSIHKSAAVAGAAGCEQLGATSMVSTQLLLSIIASQFAQQLAATTISAGAVPEGTTAHSQRQARAVTSLAMAAFLKMPPSIKPMCQYYPLQCAVSVMLLLLEGAE